MTARVLLHADVRPMHDADAHAEAVAWRDGRLIAVGAEDAVRRAAGPDAEVWDVAGATVLPGFVDAHHHPSIAALYGGVVRLSAPRVTDMASLQRTLATAAAELEPGRWLVAMDWDEMRLAERRAPTRADLDEAVPGHPLMALHYSCHRAVANSRALELAGIGRHTPDPPGGIVSRGAAGVLDGLLIERGMSPVEALARASLIARDAEGFFARLAAHHRALVEAGITRVVDATVPRDLAVLYREAARRGSLLVPTVMFPVSTSGYLEPPWEALEGPVTGSEEGPLMVGSVKLVFDGAPVCAMCLTAWQTLGAFARAASLALRLRSSEPLRSMLSVKPRLGRGGKILTGVMMYGRDEASAIVRAATEKGFSVATHAIGNQAVDVALSAYRAAGSALHRAGIPRIEHAAFLDRGSTARIADVGAAVVTQPHVITLPAIGTAPSIPDIRYLPLRWLLDAGVEVAGSSDFPIAGFDPLDGIRSAVSRRTVRGNVHEADQRIELHEALALYTRSAAKVSGCLDRCGTLEPGKRADVVVLDGRLAAGSELDRARVRSTVLGGEVVFGVPGRTGAG